MIVTLTKRLLAALLLSGALFAQVQTEPSIPIDQANAKKARAILDQMLAAMGGQAFLTYTDRQESGRTYRFSRGQSAGVGAPYVRFWRWPDADRWEMLKKREWIIIYNGDRASETTYHGTSPLDPKLLRDYLRRREFSVETALRVWLQQPGIALFYEGRTVADNKPAEQISLLTNDNRGLTLYVGTSNHLLIKKTFSYRDPESKERVEESEVYDNYKEFQGIATPLSVTRMKNDDIDSQRFLNNVSYNVGFSPADFTLATPQNPARRLDH